MFHTFTNLLSRDSFNLEGENLIMYTYTDARVVKNTCEKNRMMYLNDREIETLRENERTHSEEKKEEEKAFSQCLRVNE